MCNKPSMHWLLSHTLVVVSNIPLKTWHLSPWFYDDKNCTFDVNWLPLFNEIAANSTVDNYPCDNPEKSFWIDD